MSLLQSVVKICDSVTKSLKFPVVVQIRRYTGPTDLQGADGYSSAKPVRAILEKKQRSVQTPDGVLATSSATLIFLDVPALVAATPAVTITGGEVHRAGQLHVNDDLTMPDGSNQSILNTGGFIDSETGNPVATEVYI